MKTVAAYVVLIAFTSGCATAFKGTHQTVNVVTDPEKADLRINGDFVGASGEIALERKHAIHLEARKPGFQPAEGIITGKNDTPWVIFDIATCVIPILLCVPLAVDAISGAWNSYPDTFTLKLDPIEQPRAPAATQPGHP